MEDDSFNDILANMEIPEDPIKRQAVEETPGTSSQAEVSNEAAQVEVSKPALIQTEVPRYKNAVQVHPNQKGNPILKAITHIPWEFNSSIVPDYVVGRTACVLFLSIRYHNLKPDYIHERLKQLGKSYELRVLLVHVDIKESHNALKHLTRLCLLADLTLMLAWTTEEAGKIIETYKMFEHRTADFIMERAETNDYQKVVNALTSIQRPKVNKTDATTLLTNFGTLKNIIQASEAKLNACQGLGVRKAEKILKVFNESFLK